MCVRAEVSASLGPEASSMATLRTAAVTRNNGLRLPQGVLGPGTFLPAAVSQSALQGAERLLQEGPAEQGQGAGHPGGAAEQTGD